MCVTLMFLFFCLVLSVSTQDVTNFDVYTLQVVPWKTKDSRKPRVIQHFMDTSSTGEDIDKILKNSIPNYGNIEPKMAIFHRNKVPHESDDSNVDQKWSERRDIFETHFDDYFDIKHRKYQPFTTYKPNYEKYKPSEHHSGELESEFGKVVPPNDLDFERLEPVQIQHVTKAPEAKFPNKTYFTGLSHVQKISKIDAANFTTQSINNLLRRYMNRLYTKKYSKPRYVEIDPNDIDGEKSKFFGNGLETLALLKNKTKKIANKFLNVFQVVKFNNTACQGTVNGLQYQGVCYLAAQCSSLNGTAAGSCADGYGVCCIFRGSCGGAGSQNCSYFESMNYPDYYPPDGVLPPTPAPTPSSTTPDLRPDPRLPMLPRRVLARQMDALECSYRVTKASSDITQMRIDFLDLELLGPTNGTCVNERLVITGNGISNQIPAICGYNTGQHLYVDVSMLNGPLMLSVLSNMMYRKRYRIRICQFSQTSCMTPNNCLQYYTGVSGVISSFNYDQAQTLSRSTPSYFNNLNYAICIRREAGYCSITYTNVMNGLEYPFEIVNFGTNGQPTVMPGQAGVETFDCPNDYIIINGVRLCGNKLNDGSMNTDLSMNSPITDNSLGPIVVQVRTNGAAVGRGFKLFYTQNRCPNSF